MKGVKICSESLKKLKKKLQQAKRAQTELAVTFEAIGLNITKMNPIIYNALLKEALATSPEKAAANFITAWRHSKNRPPAMMLKHEGFEHFMLTEQGNSRIRKCRTTFRFGNAVRLQSLRQERR